MSKRTLGWLAVGLIIIGIGVSVYSYVSPTIMLRDLKEAANQGDRDKLEDLIDFDSVRSGLKDQFKTAFLVSMGKELKDNPFAALGLAMVNNIVDPLVDTLVSPSGIAALISKGQMESGVKPPDSSSATAPRPVADDVNSKPVDAPKQTASNPPIPQVQRSTSPKSAANEGENKSLFIQERYDGWSRYKITMTPDLGAKEKNLTFTLRRQGLFSWKLTQISFSNELMASFGKNRKEDSDQSDASITSQQLALLLGKYPYDAIQTQPLKDNLANLVGDKWSDFSARLDVSSEIIQDSDGQIFGAGCMPHECGDEMAAFAIDGRSGKLSAILISAGQWTGWGFEKPQDTLHGAMRKWAAENGIIDVDCTEAARLGLELDRCGVKTTPGNQPIAGAPNPPQ